MSIISSKRQLKSLLVALLSTHFPLGVNDLRVYLKNEYKLIVTPQAIHKALNILKNDEVIVVANQKYQLSHKYILNLEKQVFELKKHYFLKTPSAYAVEKGETREFTAHSLSELDRLWNDILSEKLSEMNGQKLDYVQHVPHAWFNLVQMGEEVKIAEKLKSSCNHFYTLSNGHTLLDEWLGTFYKGKKFSYTMRKKPIRKETSHQYAVFGDYVFEAHYSKNLTKRFETLFQNSKHISNLDVSELLAIVHTPNKIILTFSHNKKRAAKLRKEILTEFK